MIQLNQRKDDNMNIDYVELFDTIKETSKKDSKDGWISVGISRFQNDRVEQACKELNCKKGKFIRIAIDNLLDEFARYSSE